MFTIARVDLSLFSLFQHLPCYLSLCLPLSTPISLCLSLTCTHKRTCLLSFPYTPKRTSLALYSPPIVHFRSNDGQGKTRGRSRVLLLAEGVHTDVHPAVLLRSSHPLRRCWALAIRLRVRSRRAWQRGHSDADRNRRRESHRAIEPKRHKKTLRERDMQRH